MAHDARSSSLSLRPSHRDQAQCHIHVPWLPRNTPGRPCERLAHLCLDIHAAYHCDASPMNRRHMRESCPPRAISGAAKDPRNTKYDMLEALHFFRGMLKCLSAMHDVFHASNLALSSLRWLWMRVEGVRTDGLTTLTTADPVTDALGAWSSACSGTSSRGRAVRVSPSESAPKLRLTDTVEFEVKRSVRN
eukprot:scaffold7578_cov31-Tisochrysis_lutea.AAC.3